VIPPLPEAPGEAAVKASFLARLAAEGIVLPPNQASVAAADFLALHRQMRLIRASVAPDAPLPLGFVSPADAA
jgi:hypothetical protein